MSADATMRATTVPLFLSLVLAACGPPPRVDFVPGAETEALGEAPRTPARGVLVVLVDTLRADHVDWRDAAGPTPSLARLAARGTVFSRGYSTSSWTRPAVASAFTGRYPCELGVFDYQDALPEEVPTVAERLQAAGVRTLAVSANGNAGSRWGFARGFDAFVEPPESAFYEGDERGMIPAEVVTREGLRLLEDVPVDEPWFLVLHYTDPHAPYFAHEELTGAAPEGPFDGSRAALRELDALDPAQQDAARARIKFLYRGEVRHVDRWIGALLDGLEAAGRLEQTLVVATADHGEGLWDHGHRAHGSKPYEEQVHVPLCAAFPASWGEAPAACAGLSSLVDLAPTALAALGLEVPAELHGVDLWRTARGAARREAAYSEVAFVGVYYQALDLDAAKLIRHSAHDAPFAEREHVVREGDTLWTIAYLYYGPKNARELADANPEVFPADRPLIEVELVPGTRLALPPLPPRAGEVPLELYDLAADPGERRALAPEGAPELAARARGLHVWTSSESSRTADVGPGLDDEARAALRGLGYAE